jgi:GT2 family glycosyltransferase
MVVVDNSTDEREMARLRAAAVIDERVDVAEAPSNLGYFGAAHLWVSGRHGSVPEWTIVSNMDIELADTYFVSRLLAMDDSAAVLAPHIVGSPAGRPGNPHLSTRPNVKQVRRLVRYQSSPALAQAYVLVSELLQRLPHRSADDQRTRRPIYSAHGSFIPIHRSFFESGGTLAHPVFLFGEEMTIAEQCRKLGLTVQFEPTLRAVHHAHQSTGRLRSRRVLAAQVEAARYCYRLIAADRDV